MSFYTQWTDYVIDFVKHKGEDAFWKEYGAVERVIYSKVLAQHNNAISGTVKDLSNAFGSSEVLFMGFLDGLNDSLFNEIDLEKVEPETIVDLKINFEKLYFNMLDAKADYLYELPQWDSIFSKEKRKEIHQQWVSSKTVVNKNKTGRNEPCPCGSGKKYKNCCAK